MPIVNPKLLFYKAFAEHWALGAFNTSNLEITQAICWALEETKSPGIIQTSEATIEYAGLEIIKKIIDSVAETVSVPLVLHLDHGKSFEIVERCIEAGYQSVMIDGSAFSFEENIVLTKKVVDLAKENGVWVEGELGAIAGKEGLLKNEDGRAGEQFTKPEEAAEFVGRTGVNALAVSVGTMHGAFRGEEKIHFELLEQIHKAVPIPLVLHGASGVPEDQVKKSLQFGVTKVNIDTELREAFHSGLDRNDLKDSIDPRKILAPARDAVKEIVKQKTEVLGSKGKSVV